jgi:hypothetical protein
MFTILSPFTPVIDGRLAVFPVDLPELELELDDVVVVFFLGVGVGVGGGDFVVYETYTYPTVPSEVDTSYHLSDIAVQ